MTRNFSEFIKNDDDNDFILSFVDNKNLSSFDMYYNSEINFILEQAISKLSKEDAEICRMLKVISIRETCKQKNISVRKFYKILERIKLEFIRLSLGDYLRK